MLGSRKFLKGRSWYLTSDSATLLIISSKIFPEPSTQLQLLMHCVASFTQLQHCAEFWSPWFQINNKDQGGVIRSLQICKEHAPSLCSGICTAFAQLDSTHNTRSAQFQYQIGIMAVGRGGGQGRHWSPLEFKILSKKRLFF